MPAHLFHGLLGRIADPGKIFLETPDGSTLTYGGLLQDTARYANALAAQGLKPGDRRRRPGRESPEALILYLAAVRAGGGLPAAQHRPIPLAELDYFIGDAEPALVVCDPARRDGDRPHRAEARGAAASRPSAPRATAASSSAARGQPPEFDDVPRGEPTISRRSSTPRARPGAPRAPC